jgi:VIT1/CCC1 family predicted Fe2+/Mn2+ transporter
MDKSRLDKLVDIQRNEITEHHIYKRLASSVKGDNRKALEKVADDELSHYKFWKGVTSKEVGPDWFRVNLHYFMAKILGLNFSLRLMENGEAGAQVMYGGLIKQYPKIKHIINDEEIHERKLLDMIDEERLKYTGSIVLGLNDALVELTGALAGFTLALPNPKIVAMAGLVTGIAASMSMAGSEYLSSKERGEKNPMKSTAYTGITYFLTVLLLITPYLLMNDAIFSLAITLATAIVVIFLFNFYISVAKELPFRKRFVEMAGISLGVAAINFVIGLLIKQYFNIQI